MKIKFIPFGFQEKSDTAVPMDSEERYGYAIEQILKAKTAWTLCAEDGESIVMDVQGKECICLWPDREAVVRFLQKVPAEDGLPYQVGLEELISVAKELRKSKQEAFTVYPTAEGGYVVSPQCLYEDLTGKNCILKPRGIRHVAK